MRLPLFPLNSVLFPGMPIRLHIFEERYKEMINECVETQTPFGVILIAEGQESLGPLANPYLIGTTAHISEVQKLPFGRMNIMAIGRERFKVTAFDRNSRSFLMGDVAMLPFNETYSIGVTQGSVKLRTLVERYLSVLSEAGQLQVDMAQIPYDPLPLAYLAAMLMQDDADKKQNLLEAENTKELIRQLLRIYQREVALLDVMLNPPSDDIMLPFSPN